MSSPLPDPVDVVQVTPKVQRQIDALLPTEAERFEFELFLGLNPAAGDSITGAGGWRKLRWAMAGGGKSGGLRAITLYRPPHRVYVALAYPKSKKVSLTNAQKNKLKRVAQSLD